MSRPHWLIPDAAYQSYDAYLADVGENAVLQARRMNPDQVLSEVRQSGLRGRGGAGFPTGTKWSTLRRHPCATRYVVCNAAEGEPGTFKDRYLLDRNPYATLEGMLIAAHVVGARHLYVAIKESFARQSRRLQQALAEFTAQGLLKGLRFTILEGPEEYLFGEEKALLNVIEGVGPLPREAHYPPYEVGLFAHPDSPNPALVNNVQTFAHVPDIIRHGAASFRELGTSDTPGTLLFTISGHVPRPGVYERQAGITLRELFHEVAGGPLPGRRFKAALAGVSTGVIPADKFDTPADFGSLHMIGSGLASAGFILFDDTASMPRVAQMAARFLYVESCNQCTACKHGLRTASTTLDAMFEPGGADADTFERALAGAQHAPQANRCYLPVQGAALVTSLMSRFREEFEALLAGRAEPSRPIPVPKMTDFDEASGTFSYDALQAHKNPDWTYAVPPPTPSKTKPATPAPVSAGPVSVRLAADVHQALAGLAETGSPDLERAVNDALREWLKSGQKE